MMTTSTFTVPQKRGGDLRATITREPATLNEARAKNPRWFLEVGEQNILSAEVVSVLLESAAFPVPERDRSWRTHWYLVVKTATGEGVVCLGSRDGSCADRGADLAAFIPAAKGAAKVWGIFVCKKRGQWCGEVVPLLVALKRGVKTCCGAEIYARLAGKPWGEPRPTAAQIQELNARWLGH